MTTLPPKSTRTDTLYPYTTLFLSAAGDLEPAVVAGARHRLQTHPDLGHGPEIGRHVEVDVMAGIDRAEVDLLVRLDDEPTVAPRLGQAAVDELDGAAAARHRSEERRVGKEGVSTCRSRCQPNHSKQTYYQT